MGAALSHSGAGTRFHPAHAPWNGLQVLLLLLLILIMLLLRGVLRL